MDAIYDILVSYATNAPIVAFLLWQIERQRADYKERLERKDLIIDRMLERERVITDKAVDIVMQK